MKTRKITVEISDELLRKAQKESGQGTTATVRQGLELLAAGAEYSRLRRLRGKVSFSIDEKTMRKDR